MRILFAFIIIALGTSLYGQGISDVIRYSEISPLGTARTVGAGSSFGAMGGDFSVININPAGIGTYKKSEFVITPTIGSSKTDAYLSGESQNGIRRNKSVFTIDNFGLVSTSSPSGSKWTTSNFAIGLTKLKDFGREFSFSGASEGSITEQWAAQAQGKTLDELDDFVTWPAVSSGALIALEDNTYATDYFRDDIVTKAQGVEQSGSINELSFGWAGSYDGDFNLGVSVGVPFVSFEETKLYRETVDARDDEGNQIFTNDLRYSEFLNTTGTGINFKLGMIYAAHKHLRLGAALHSPTWYALSDDFSSTTAYDYEYFTDPASSGSGSEQSPDGSFDYNFTSPWKFVGSVGSLYDLGEVKGFFNADFEYLDYTNAELNLTKRSSRPSDIEANRLANAQIDQELTSTTNIRLGTELAYQIKEGAGVRLRLGYAFIGSPFFNESGYDNYWSTGVGFRTDGFFIDLGYRRTTDTEGYLAYTAPELDRDPLTEINTTTGRLEMTVGFKF